MMRSHTLNSEGNPPRCSCMPYCSDESTLRKRIAEVAVKGDRAVLTAAVKDNMDLAASETTPILQQAWAGTFAALLVRVRVQIELVGDASRFVSEIEGAGREQAASGGARE